jgi:hypothetical protein
LYRDDAACSEIAAGADAGAFRSSFTRQLVACVDRVNRRLADASRGFMSAMLRSLLSSPSSSHGCERHSHAVDDQVQRLGRRA